MMLDDEGDVPTSSKKKLDKNQPVDNVSGSGDGIKLEKSDAEDPKPRIVLTIRSEKSGSKNSNMKIVPNEEKHEEFSPRRSSRTRVMRDWTDEADSISPKKEKNHCVSENDEVSDSSTAKRSSRRRSKDSSDNVLANAIARKEKSYNETVPSQRLSRRIKPTAKVLENEELRIGLESQNNARLGIQSDRSEEGVRTRRSARPIRDQNVSTKTANTSKTAKGEDSADQEDNEKLRHLCELGLKAKGMESMEEDGDADTRDSEENECEILEDEEIDDDTEVISKLLEADDETVSEGSDDDFSCSDEASQTEKGPHTRRSTRLNSTYENDSEESSTVPDDDKSPPRRSARRSTRLNYYEAMAVADNDDSVYVPRRKKSRTTRGDRGEESPSEVTHEENSNPAGGDEGSEAACPEDDSAVVATCYCDNPSNVYAAPDELTEPVFCQAIEISDGIRVGCSHVARREAGALAPMVRAGLRAPYFLACVLHTEQLKNHMCCPACGLFCTQGIFYQCSEKHLFHLECGLPYNENKSQPGCPHCGVRSYRWLPANQRCVSVRLEMHCSNKRILLPERRQQCTPAYLSFSPLSESQVKQFPLIPDDLLPNISVDLDLLKSKTDEDMSHCEALQLLKEAIVAGETADQLVPKIALAGDISVAVDDEGETCAHIAAGHGRLAALYLLQCAGAQLDNTDHKTRTPLMMAVQALLDKDGISKSAKHLKSLSVEDMEVDDEIKEDTNKEEKEIEEKPEEQEKEAEPEEKGVEPEDEKEAEPVEEKEVEPEEEKEAEPEEEKEAEPEEEEKETEIEVDEEELFKVIRFLIAAGCDLNFPGPEGLTVLHMCAAHGGKRAEAVARQIVKAGATVDATDQGGWTPLVWAAEHKHADIVRLLLDAGANASVADNEGNGAVHWCSLGGDDASLLAILDSAPLALQQANQHGDTPLHIAARHGHYSCVVILLARGAMTQVPNAAGELPLDVCGEHENCRNAITINIQLSKISRGATKRLLCNDISFGRERHPVPCVNEVDDAPAPDDFTYVTAHVTPDNILIDNAISTLQGCSCSRESGSCLSNGCACCVLGVRRWYCGGVLPASFPYHEPPMLFECNLTCRCDLRECGNSVVTRLASKGSLGIRACVFRRGALGWGLRARQQVPRGTAVALYCGELLTMEAADTRANDQYMFALDVKPDLLEQCSDQTILCVDAAQYGSAARFINHSCAPNLAPVRVFTTTRDLRLPAVALFATRDIRPDEELTFDYGDKFWSVKAKWMKCECGAPDCRYPEKIQEEDDS